MKYIGNKTRLLDLIDRAVKYTGIIEGVFCDIFAGTCSVSKHYKKKGFNIIANDLMYYSFVEAKAYIENNKKLKFKNFDQNHTSTTLEKVLDHLNSLDPVEGFIYKNYAPTGSSKHTKYKRQYFTDKNAKMIDSVRREIENLKTNKNVNEVEYYFLLSHLINHADYLANISGTYGAYLKIWRTVALNNFEMKPTSELTSKKKHYVHNQDANDLIKNIECDILYLDPPYNTRQYASNFHMLETIALYDNPKIYGKTGLRPYEDKKSKYSSKANAFEAFNDLINNANTKYIILSYNDEGIISFDDIEKSLKSLGKVKKIEKIYRRFRTERDHEKRQYKKRDDKVIERVYVCEVIK